MPAPIRTNKGAAGALFFAVALALPALGEAQVYKCNVAGKTVYQESPCAAGKGSVLDLPAGPSAQEIKDAQSRANAEKGRLAAPAAPAKPPEAPRASVSGAYCADLYRQHAQLVRERNNAARAERRLGGGGVLVGKDPVAERFDQLEAQMRRANCAVPQ